MSFQFETVDFIRFAPVVLRQCMKKGHLQELKNGTETSRSFYCLFGNLLYAFANESDPSSVLGMMFLESCTCKIVNLDQPVLSITTVGGRGVTLVGGGSKEELQEWMESIESSKMKNITRKLDDMEAEMLQSQHRDEEQERVRFEYESSMIELRKQIKDLEEKQEELKATIRQIESEKEDLKRRLKSTDSERLLLLKSRGITPKTLPAWALHENPRRGVSEPLKSLRLWTGTWNLSGKEPFAGMQKDRAKRLLQPFVPDGYDLYVLGVQECPNENVYECLDALLSHEGCRRMKMEGFSVKDGEDLSDPSKIYGRNDGGSLQSLKFTGIVAYCKMNLMGDIRILTVTNFPFSNGKSKGAVAMVCSVFGRTVVFVNAHLEAKNNEVRRDQYQNLIIALGSNLAEQGFHLNEQFNHIIWLGDFNFALVDTSGNNMPVDTAIKLLEDGRVLRTLFETHDQLNQDKKQQLVFYGYREPCPFPNFFPTYKKIENRPPVNYSSPDWVKNTYRTQVKDSFFRGSSNKERVPKFSDRILYFSMPDLAEDLLPEALSSDMQVQVSAPNDSPPGRSKNNLVEKTSKISIRVDNYRSVNDGEAMTASDHSPVFCTFLLRLRHDHGILQQQVTTSKAGDIQNLLNALGSNDTSTVDPSKTTDENADSPSTEEPPKTPPKRQWYTSNRNSRRASSPEKRLSSTQDANISTATPESHSPSLPLIEKMSLLPHGIYKIRISEIKLVWGMNEECPIQMSVLFPAPYEALAGERFVEFESENCNNDFIGESSYRHGSPSRRPPSSPTKTPQHSQTQHGVDSCWRKLGNSKTGTCMKLDIDRSPLLSCAEHRSTKDIPALVLTWKGDEPLDRLHICVKATTQAKTIRSPMARPKSINGMNNNTPQPTPNANGVTYVMDINNNPVMVDMDEKITGHCSIALEQLCKVAIAGTAGSSISTTAARILINRGRPMYNIDTKTLQREMVTLCCKLELEQG